MDKSKYLMPENSGYHIYAFMRNSFNLTSNELTVYAVIFGFSQGGQGCFYGSREYLSACTGANVRTINRVLSSLIEKNLILKRSSITSHGITNIYTVNMEKVKEATKKPNFTKIDCPETKEVENQNGETNCPDGVGQNVSGVGQNVSGGRTKCPTYYYREKNIEEREGASASPQPRPRSNVDNSTSKGTSSTGFKKPTREEIEQYIKEKQLNVDGAVFYDYYESNGWYVGKNKMKNWKASLNNWSRRESKFGQNCSKQSMAVTYAPVEFNNF